MLGRLSALGDLLEWGSAVVDIRRPTVLQRYSLTERFLLADVRLTWTWTGTTGWIHPDGMLGVMPMPSPDGRDDLWRIIAYAPGCPNAPDARCRGQRGGRGRMDVPVLRASPARRHLPQWPDAHRGRRGACTCALRRTRHAHRRGQPCAAGHLPGGAATAGDRCPSGNEHGHPDQRGQQSNWPICARPSDRPADEPRPIQHWITYTRSPLWVSYRTGPLAAEVPNRAPATDAGRLFLRTNSSSPHWRAQRTPRPILGFGH